MTRLETLLDQSHRLAKAIDRALNESHRVMLAITDERSKLAASPTDSRGEGESALVAAGVNDGSFGLDGSPLRRHQCATCAYHAATVELLDNHVRAAHNRVLWLSERAVA